MDGCMNLGELHLVVAVFSLMVRPPLKKNVWLPAL